MADGSPRPISGKFSQGPRWKVVNRNRIAARRAYVADLMLTGRHTIDSVVEELKAHPVFSKGGTSHRIVADDMKSNVALWRQGAVRSTEEWVNKEIARLEELEFVAVERLRNVEFVFKSKGALVRYRTNAQAYINAVLRIQERRAELLGLDQPQKADSSLRRC